MTSKVRRGNTLDCVGCYLCIIQFNNMRLFSDYNVKCWKIFGPHQQFDLGANAANMFQHGLSSRF